MNNKRIAAILLSLCMVFGFAACGETSSGKEEPGGQTPVEDPEKNPEKDPEKDSEKDPEKDPETDPDKPEDTGVSELTFEEDIREDYINWFGRNLYSARGESVACNNTASGFEVAFYGTELTFDYVSEEVTQSPGFLTGDCYLCIQVDGSEDYVSSASFTRLPRRRSEGKFTLAKGLEEGLHTVAVYKATEAFCITLEVFGIKTDGFFLDPPEKKALKVEAFGDSIVAGRGSNREPGATETDASPQENGMASYAAFAARALGAQYNTFCVSGSCVGNYYHGTDAKGNEYSNEGAVVIPSMIENYSPSANAMYPWDFSLYQPDVVFIEMGTNDIIGNYTYRYRDFEDQLRTNYANFIKKLRGVYPSAKIVACCGSFSYTKYPVHPYNSIFSEIVKEFEEDGNVYCYTFASPCKKGHPAYSEAQSFGNSLAEFVRGIL